MGRIPQISGEVGPCRLGHLLSDAMIEQSCWQVLGGEMPSTRRIAATLFVGLLATMLVTSASSAVDGRIPRPGPPPMADDKDMPAMTALWPPQFREASSTA